MPVCPEDMHPHSCGSIRHVDIEMEGSKSKSKIPQKRKSVEGEGDAVLMINNTLAHGLMEFVPNEGKVVKWYTCGPTVCDMPHLGHCRTYLTFDIIRRVMQDYFGYEIVMCMGITDIDDKIIVRTRQIQTFLDEGWSWQDALKSLTEIGGSHLCEEKTTTLARRWLSENCIQVSDPLSTVPVSPTKARLVGNQSPIDTSPLTREMERLFFADMKRLGIRPPTVITRVTEFIPSIISFVERIMNNGYAYESNGNIYFDITAFTKKHTYAKLMPVCSGHDTKGTLTGNCEGVLYCNVSANMEKRHPKDFVLWKNSKELEPKWESPWGFGRPGWHIECSVMASEILGEKFDVHSGGEDLKFPHHDSELAQSEAHWETDSWVNYFIHHGHLHIDGRNMMHGLKNFLTIQGALECYTAAQLRMLFLLHPYDGAIMFSKNSMNAALQQEEIFSNFFKVVDALLDDDMISTLAGRQSWREPEKKLNDFLLETQANVHGALCDNFATPLAVCHLRQLSKATLDYIASQDDVRLLLVKSCREYIQKLFKCFGLINDCADEGARYLQTPAQRAFKTEEVQQTVDCLQDFKNNIKTKLSELFETSECVSPDELITSLEEMCDTVTNDLAQVGVVENDNTWEYTTKSINSVRCESVDISDNRLNILMSLPTLPPLDS